MHAQADEILEPVSATLSHLAMTSMHSKLKVCPFGYAIAAINQLNIAVDPFALIHIQMDPLCSGAQVASTGNIWRKIQFLTDSQNLSAFVRGTQ